MKPNDAAYLAKFREAHAKRKKITGTVGDLRAICEPLLRDWQKVAAELGASGGRTQQEWSDVRLKGLAELRAAMIAYHQLMQELTKLWNAIPPDDRDGLVDPVSLTQV